MGIAIVLRPAIVAVMSDSDDSDDSDDAGAVEMLLYENTFGNREFLVTCIQPSVGKLALESS